MFWGTAYLEFVPFPERTYGAGNERINEIFEVLCAHALTAAMCTLQ